MLKYTHKHHPDYALITKALSALGVLLQEHNKGIDSSASDHAHKLLAVGNSIYNIEDIARDTSGTGLVKTGRKFIHEGEVSVKEKAGAGQKSKTLHVPGALLKRLDIKGTMKPYLFLFDDVLFLCEQCVSTKNQTTDKPFIYATMLNLVDVLEVQLVDKDTKTVRLLRVGGSMWVLKTKSSEEGGKWLSLLRQTVSRLNGSS